MKILKLDELSLPKSFVKAVREENFVLKRSFIARSGKFDISSSALMKNKISQSMS